MHPKTSGMHTAPSSRSSVDQRIRSLLPHRISSQLKFETFSNTAFDRLAPLPWSIFLGRSGPQARVLAKVGAPPSAAPSTLLSCPPGFCTGSIGHLLDNLELLFDQPVCTTPSNFQVFLLYPILGYLSPTPTRHQGTMCFVGYLAFLVYLPALKVDTPPTSARCPT